MWSLIIKYFHNQCKDVTHVVKWCVSGSSNFSQKKKKSLIRLPSKQTRLWCFFMTGKSPQRHKAEQISRSQRTISSVQTGQDAETETWTGFSDASPWGRASVFCSWSCFKAPGPRPKSVSTDLRPPPAPPSSLHPTQHAWYTCRFMYILMNKIKYIEATKATKAKKQRKIRAWRPKRGGWRRVWSKCKSWLLSTDLWIYLSQQHDPWIQSWVCDDDRMFL